MNNNLSKMDFETYIKDSTININSYHKNCYKKYLKFTNEQIKRIEELKNNSGKRILYKRGNKNTEMILICVEKGEYENINYESFPYDIRLNYVDYKTNHKRVWNGFWTMNIEKITIIN